MPSSDNGSRKKNDNGSNNSRELPADGHLNWDNIQRDGLPSCSYCRNLRRVRKNVSVDHSDFGKLVPCPVCGSLAVRRHLQEQYKKKKKRIARYSELVGRAKEQTFDNFEARAGEENCKNVGLALVKAEAFAEKPQGFLVLHGPRGTGKSHLAAAITNAIQGREIKSGMPPLVMYFVVPELLDMLRSGYDEGDYQELLDLCKQIDVLILDDLGTEASKPWVQEKLFQIVNRRYLDRRATVVATNCRLRDIEPRLRSRLAEDDNTVIHIVAPDYRQRKRNPGKIV
jgi:DNA replication protein DnaC